MPTRRWFTPFLLSVIFISSVPASAGWLNSGLKNLKLPRAVVTAPASPVGNDVKSPVGAPPQYVSEGDRTLILKRISEYDMATTRLARVYENILFTLTLGTILIGLAASIAAFCKHSTLAGILSITAAAILGIGSALPISQSADFYRLLSAQSRALHLEAELSTAMTITQYSGLREGLKTLIAFEGDKFPSRSNTTQATQSLLAQLRALVPPASVSVDAPGAIVN